jgi:hypothetical protein
MNLVKSFNMKNEFLLDNGKLVWISEFSFDLHPKYFYLKIYINN